MCLFLEDKTRSRLLCCCCCQTQHWGPLMLPVTMAFVSVKLARSEAASSAQNFQNKSTLTYWWKLCTQLKLVLKQWHFKLYQPGNNHHLKYVWETVMKTGVHTSMLIISLFPIATLVLLFWILNRPIVSRIYLAA